MTKTDDAVKDPSKTAEHKAPIVPHPKCVSLFRYLPIYFLAGLMIRKRKLSLKG